MTIEKLEFGNYYHIFSHGAGYRNLYKETSNYEYFLHLYEKYIEPVAETYAWALMPNHFHFLVRLKENIGYKYSNADGSVDTVRFNEIEWETSDLSACEAPGSVRIPKPEKHVSHLLNSYTRYYNTKYGSKGTMFERPFKRKRIDNFAWLRRTILYIHNNPVHPVK
ncbi:MAG: hypothetical protein JW761_04010, partial [Prolixibacteraceae bacterium]|nr:hypothetical protein [Prolixibacteraceae bacterium]